MSSRPKSTDTEADLQKMQDEYLKQSSDENFRPAAVAVNKREPKQSVFAKQKGLKKTEAKAGKTENSEVFGEIVERKVGKVDQMEIENTPEGDGFPKPPQIVTKAFKDTGGKSIFSQFKVKAVNTRDNKDVEAMETDEPVAGPSQNPKADIHEQNMQTLSQMSQEEILAEQKKLLQTMDPKAIEFLKNKRAAPPSASLQKPLAKSPRAKAAEPKKPLPEVADIPALDFLKDEGSGNWLHFDVLETEKLEWTKNLEKTCKTLKPGQEFEARFDWKGFLQPYTGPENTDKDDRELYMHSDSQRPGYTLQEFFRLARAEVLQQKVAAINAIAGILSIYNQGYYDTILELPMAKIFFFLRFALDENKPAVMEASSRALAFLFYNETDETLLDVAYETRHGKIQPVMDNKRASLVGSADEETDFDFESSLKNLTIAQGQKPFRSNVDDLIDADEDQDKDSMTDFHLAETNLVECLMKANILKRINYIVTTTQPNEVTLRSCLKLLIRLARKGRDFATEIINTDTLIAKLIVTHLPSLDKPTKPEPLVLKLFRVLAAYGIPQMGKLRSFGVVDIVKSYISTMRESNVALYKLQIESFRFLRLYFHFCPDEALFKDLVGPIHYQLDQHFKHLDFSSDNHFILRQHASSLMYLIGCGERNFASSTFGEKIKMCLCKWFTMATRDGAREFSQKLLLSAILEVATGFVSCHSDAYFDFVKRYLMKYMEADGYQKMTSQLCETSPLFQFSTDRSNALRSLINLGAVTRKHKLATPSLILSNEYSSHLMNSLFAFIEAFSNASHPENMNVYRELSQLFFSEAFEPYLEGFAKRFNRNLIANWFLKTEIDFIYSLVFSSTFQFSDHVVKVAFNLLTCLTQENYKKILKIIHTFLDQKHFFAKDVTQAEFQRWKYIYNGMLMSKIDLKVPKEKSAVAEKWNQLMLTDAWPYSLLMLILYEAEADADVKKVVEMEVSQEELILTALKFTLLLEANNVNLVSANQQLMYLMVVYFAKNLCFREEPIKKLIRRKMASLRGHSFPPKFNFKLNKEKSFESLYTMFLDTFQSSSYGDDLFSALVMVPLCQKYDPKWRKLAWSEYAGSMTFVTCNEADLIEGIDEYLNPVETDLSILRSYAAAMHTLREGTITRKIAKHHLEHAKKTGH